MFEFIIKNKIYVTYIFEFIAAVAGVFYLLKTSSRKPGVKTFVYYLCFIFLADLFGLYAIWAYYDNYETLPFLKNSPLHRNFWWYNIIHVVILLSYAQLFIRQLVSDRMKKIRKILSFGLIILVLYSIVCYSTFGEFLFDYDISVLILNAFFMLICIGAYYYDILTSDKILDFSKEIIFFISVGTLIYQLCVTPIQIYTSYFNQSNPDFIKFYAAVLRYANIFMYSLFALGFYMDYRYRKNKIKNMKISSLNTK